MSGIYPDTDNAMAGNLATRFFFVGPFLMITRALVSVEVLLRALGSGRGGSVHHDNDTDDNGYKGDDSTHRTLRFQLRGLKIQSCVFSFWSAPFAATFC